MSTENRNFGKAAVWILLSPLLFLMAAISTVESDTAYYVQLVVFGFATLLGIATDIAYIFGWPWGAITARYLLLAIVVVFVGIPLLIGLTLLWQYFMG